MALGNVMGYQLRYLHKWYEENQSERTDDPSQPSKADQDGLEGNNILSELNSLVTAKYYIPGLKYAMGQLPPLFGGDVRSPILPLPPGAADEIQKCMNSTITAWNNWQPSHPLSTTY